MSEYFIEYIQPQIICLKNDRIPAVSIYWCNNNYIIGTKLIHDINIGDLCTIFLHISSEKLYFTVISVINNLVTLICNLKVDLTLNTLPLNINNDLILNKNNDLTLNINNDLTLNINNDLILNKNNKVKKNHKKFIKKRYDKYDKRYIQYIKDQQSKNITDSISNNLSRENYELNKHKIKHQMTDNKCYNLLETHKYSGHQNIMKDPFFGIPDSFLYFPFNF
jgi:hypothetical protein